MIRLLLLLLCMAALGLGAAWIADHPGNVTMFWLDYRIDTSVAFLLALAAIAVLMLAYVYVLLRNLLFSPARFSERLRGKNYRKGLSELTISVAALAAGDITSAEAHTRKATKLLGEAPLTLLLSAQIARGRGEEAKAKALLERMLDHPETEYLAARSLADAAGKQNLLAKALPLAERASKINPREKSSATALIGLHIRMQAWQEALQSIDRAMRRGALGRRERNHYKGIAYLAHGLQLLQQSQAEAARANGWASVKLLPHFAPAIVLAARALMACGQPEQATKLILKHWHAAAHPELAAMLRLSIAKLPADKQMKLTAKLLSGAPDHAESHLALAETAIKHKQWDAARKALKAALAKDDSARACKLMAYVEQGEFSDYDAAGRWLARSSEAQGDAAWLCSACAQPSEHWHAHCPACGAFDAQEWKRPIMTFVA